MLVMFVVFPLSLLHFNKTFLNLKKKKKWLSRNHQSHRRARRKRSLSIIFLDAQKLTWGYCKLKRKTVTFWRERWRNRPGNCGCGIISWAEATFTLLSPCHQNKAPQVSTEAANILQAQFLPMTNESRCFGPVASGCVTTGGLLATWQPGNQRSRAPHPGNQSCSPDSHFLVILSIPRIADWQTVLNIWALGGLPKPQHWPWRKVDNVLAQNLKMCIQPIYSMKLMKTIHSTLFQKYDHMPVY